MLGTSNVHPVIAVANLDAAKQFYTNILGLKPIMSNENSAMTLQSGDSKMLLYVSDYAGTNKATAATWQVDDVEAVIEELEKKDVTFEEYSDIEGIVMRGHVHVMGETEAAWFKDPDGNILCISNTI